MSIPDGDDALPLRWKDEVLELPIVRNAIKAYGVTNAPLPKATFERILKSVLNLSGYFGTATVHAIRRALGKKLDGNYTEVQRSQHINQSDPRVYGQSYVANTSSADGRRRFAGEEPQHDHINYFQGFSQFREKGLPRQLPAKEKARVNEDSQLLDLQKRIRSLRNELASDLDIKHATNEARNYKARVIKKRSAQFQLEWVRQRRDWKIDTRVKGRPEDDTKTDLESALARVMPERLRLARTMLSERPTTEQGRKQCVADLRSLISQDFTAFSLPGERLVNGKCLVTGCKRIITSWPKRQQSMHIHTCRRQEIANKLERMQSELIYCYDCFDCLQFDDDISFLYHLDDVHSLRMSPQTKKSWPNWGDSKSPICWIPDTMRQKRERPDKNEEEMLRAKRHACKAQIGTREVPIHRGSLHQENSDATQMPPVITPSEVSLVDTAFDDDAIPELSHSDSAPSSEIDNFQSIDDFSTDKPNFQTELPDLFELVNDPSIIQPSQIEALLLSEETVFSQYLRSPSPEGSDTQIISHNVKDSVNVPPHCISPPDACLLPEDHQSTESISRHPVNSKGDPKISTKPRITLRLNPPKSSRKPKLTLKLSQPKVKTARISAFRNTKSRQRRRR
ncbi:hypothetical protein ACLMJK_009396 [Lecanora helva]